MGVGAGLYMYDVVIKEFTFAISSPDEFLSFKTINSLCIYILLFIGEIFRGTVDIRQYCYGLSVCAVKKFYSALNVVIYH